MNWYSIKFLPDNKFVKFVAIWLIILPYIIKLLESFNITPLDPWYSFFFAALSFTIANVIYLLSCPNIIKDHISFTGFIHDGKTKLHLLEYQAQIGDISLLTSNDTNDEDALRNDFWRIHQKAKTYRCCCMCLCILFYFIGFFLVSIGICQQIEVVIHSFFHNILHMQIIHI